MLPQTLTFQERLPGILCETAIPVREENSLRLDVAAFVGFAERGPVDVPVMLQDFNQYKLLFGGDLPLALSEGLPVYAHLPRTVEGFFENGGERCYVVRIAGAGHRANHFYLPGLLFQGADGEWQPVEVAAAWPGRWSDSVSIGTSLRARPLKVRDEEGPFRISGAEITTGAFSIPLRVPSSETVRVGDLLRLQLFSATQDAYVAYCQVGSIQQIQTPAPSLLGVPLLVQPPLVQPDAASAHVFATQPEARIPSRVHQLTEQGWKQLPFESPGIFGAGFAHDIVWRSPAAGDESHGLLLPIAREAGIETGDLLRISGPDEQPDIFMTVGRVVRSEDPSVPEGMLLLEAVLPLEVAALANQALYTLAQVDLLTFDLAIREGVETLEVWHDLRFGPGERDWRDVAAAPINRDDPQPAFFEIDYFASHSLRLGESITDAARLPLPLGLGVGSTFHGPLSDLSATGKDGLDTFEPAALFIDAAFRTVSTRALLTTASDLLYLAPQPRRLRGIHSLIPVDEVALISLPDLVHLGWERVDRPPFVEPEPPTPEEEAPVGFHPCPQPAVTDEEGAQAMPVWMLELQDASEAADGAAALENLPEQRSPQDFDEDGLIEVQRALVRLCAGRGDITGILTLPHHYANRSIEQWRQSLTNTPDFFDGDPLSYSAVYHGWIGIREGTTPALAPLRYVPPGGIVCGMIAAREIRRGPWIAPANVALRSVVDLSPNFTDSEWMPLYNRQVNILRRQPGRYGILSALTLARDRFLIQLSVRRLLIFLRKLALREGQRYIFETNNERFRTLVQTYFERVLTRILDLGGIAAFQVVTNDEINTRNDYDNGRFLIALKIAPTLPIEFITLILLRTGHDGIELLER